MTFLKNQWFKFNFYVHFAFFIIYINCDTKKCEKYSVTTASGELVNKFEKICSGELIFEDNFTDFDFEKWQHENTLAGGGNWEFQWYTNNRSNSFVKDGNLNIRPTLTADIFGENFLTTGTLNILGGTPADECTNPSYWGCERIGTPMNVLNPVRSAKIKTAKSFNFKYGRLEIKAKLPSGDWLWPAIWLLPKNNAYGPWPSSGEIDLVESRGNTNLYLDGVHIGNEQIASSLHFGPYSAVNAYKTTHFIRNSQPGKGYDKKFHRYQLEWTPDHIKFSLDDMEIGSVNSDRGFWKRGRFDDIPNLSNPWVYGTEMAPFDKEFYLIISLAVGGITYFPDNAESNMKKPWQNNVLTAVTDFWNSRRYWLPSWNLKDEKNITNSTFLIDYIRIYAI